MTVEEQEVQVSENFRIKRAIYGGRACYASSDLKKDSCVLEVSDYMGCAILYEFRKEVCHWCLSYNYGTMMKSKINWADVADMFSELHSKISAKQYKGSGLWFCTEECKRSFLHQKNIGELLLLYETVLVHFQSMQRHHNCVAEDTHVEEKYAQIEASKMQNVIEKRWEEIELNWIPKVAKMKQTKLINELPKIDEDSYSSIRFVLECIFNLKQQEKDSIKLNAWKSLQSNEVEKITTFPVLLDHQMVVFKWVYILAPNFRNILTPAFFRHILGSEYGNSFGIWEIAEESDSREYLGYMVLPEASYFNHSCDPNVQKKRVGRTFKYPLKRDVEQDEELCIDYREILNLDVADRRKILKSNWFFECRCSRCVSEL